MMDNQDKQAFAEIMVALAENYGQSVTKAGMALRFDALREYTIADVRRAAMSLLRSRKYTTMPTVADFIEHLGGGSAEDKAEAAVGKALRAVSEVGRYASVAFDDAVLMAVIEQGWGSWPDFCAACTGQDVKFVRRELFKAYMAYARQGIRRYGHLSGMTENSNGSAGYFEHIPDPYLVGNKDKAAMISQTKEQVGAKKDEQGISTVAALHADINRELPYAAGQQCMS